MCLCRIRKKKSIRANQVECFKLKKKFVEQQIRINFVFDSVLIAIQIKLEINGGIQLVTKLTEKTEFLYKK